MVRSKGWAVIAISMLLPGCITGLEGIPKNLQADARIRLKECKAWSDTIAPSRDNSGSISIAGTGLGLRSAVYRNTGAQNEYLIGIRSFIDECNRWAKFEITDQDYRAAKLRLSSLAERTLTPESYIAALSELRDQLKQASSETLVSIGELRDAQDLEPISGPADSELASIENRLAEIERLLKALPRMQETQDPGETILVDDRQEGTNIRIRHRVFFDVNSFSPSSTELVVAKQRFQGALADCQHRQWLFTGYSDQTGSRVANLTLSFARAEAVRQALAIEVGLDDTSVLAGGTTGRFGPSLESNRTVQIDVFCAKARD